jgi:MFS family permease
MRVSGTSSPEQVQEPSGPLPGAPQATTTFLSLVVVLTFVMNMVARGVTETFAVFLLPVQTGLGATRAEMTATYSVFALGFAISAPFVGQIIDRLGVRFAYVFGLLALGLGYTAAGLVTAPWQYYLVVGLCGGLGAASLGMIVASSILARWFTRRMGSVVSLPYAAMGAGMLVVPPVTQLLVDAWGWRIAHEILGAATLAIIPIVLLLPLGRVTAGSPEWRAARARQAGTATGGWTVAAALRTSAFWGLAWAYFCTSVAAYSVLPQSVAYLVEQGFNPLFAASAFGLTGALSAVGIVLVGQASDRIGKLPTVTVTYLVTIAGLVSLLLVAVWPSAVLVYGFVLLFGLMQGARGPIIVSMISKLYQGGAVGGIFGTLSIAMGTGQAFGSFVSGLLQQWTGAYMASFALGIAGALGGLAAFWIVPSLRHERIGGTPDTATPAR